MFKQRIVWTLGGLFLMTAILLALRLGHPLGDDAEVGAPATIEVITSAVGSTKTSLDRPASSRAAAGTDDPEDSPEFFAALVEEAEPLLANLLAEKDGARQRRQMEAELRALQRPLRLAEAQVDAIRRDLLRNSSFTQDPNPDIQSVARVRAEAAARRERWTKISREIIRRHLSPSQRASYDDHLGR